MPRFKLTLEYAGTRYSGWQVQKNARTVQGELESAIRRATGDPHVELYASGRTDAGVHALRQVAHLDLPAPPPSLPGLCHAINDGLPSDINVLAIEPVTARFHARHGATGRSYLYQISRRRTAFGKRSVWWVKDALDVAAMRHASRAFVGMRDFRAFTADDPGERSTRVLVDSVEIAEEDPLILVRVRGSHFLWKMVRRIVGVLVEVGRGGLSAEDVPALLGSASPVPAQLTAPPSGLFLERVVYEGEVDQEPLQGTLRLTPVPLPSPARPRDGGPALIRPKPKGAVLRREERARRSTGVRQAGRRPRRS